MSPRVVGHGRRQKARGWRAADQARPLLLALSLAGLGACTERFSEIDPRIGFANLFGAHLEGREPPPGLDQPWPNLSSVPPRPTPTDLVTRERLSAGLAQDRAESRTPQQLAPRRSGAVPDGPPAPPRLAAAPALRFDAPAPRPEPAALPVPAPPAGPQAAPAQPAPAHPAAAPRPAEPPGADLLAPPPPPSRDLLAPRRD
jgi:hypothetical protein